MVSWRRKRRDGSGEDAARPPGEAPPPPDRTSDWSHVTSREEAERLAETGELVPILLMPARFGGAPVPVNTVFAPPWFAAVMAREEDAIEDHLRKGLVNQLEVNPTYAGASQVPTSLHVRAWHSESDSAHEATLDIWQPPDA